jgi:hypothetical protein
MHTIQEFLVVAAIATGSGGPADHAGAFAALDAFVAGFAQEDEQAAFGAARVGLDDMRFTGPLSDALNKHVDARIRRTGGHA